MKMAVVVSISVAAAVLAAGLRFSRSGYETAAYRVLADESPFQLREYSELVLATTAMAGWDLERDGSFMRLFRYISGDNAAAEEISMTTPVFLRRSDDSAKMSFVVPREVAERGAPAATSPEVEIETMSGGRFAAYRFSGVRDEQAYREARARLQAWVEERGWRTEGSPIVAGYDPPFVPGFLRRNEVIVRVAGVADAVAAR
jgi:DNA gyrase inhibitor GyrI